MTSQDGPRQNHEIVSKFVIMQRNCILFFPDTVYFAQCVTTMTQGALFMS